MFNVKTIISTMALCLAACATQNSAEDSLTLRDAVRQRDVQVHLYRPRSYASGTIERPCPVVLFSPGTGLPNTAYSFLADALTHEGYLMVAVQQDLPSDPPMPDTGNLIRDRMPTWQRGVANLRFARTELAKRFPGYAWDQLVLMGHSTGGDISSLLATQLAEFSSTLVTLDHRRMALPRNPALHVLSVRGSDFQADPGVLPSQTERLALGYCIVNLPHANHDDMNDDGPSILKATLVKTVTQFLRGMKCGALAAQ